MTEHSPADAGELRAPVPVLEKAVAAAFQASMALAEAGPLRFRLFIAPPGDLPESGAPNIGVLRLSFDHSRSFNAEELQREKER